MFKNTLKALITLILSVSCYIIIALLCSLIFLKTDIGEGSLPLFSVISTAVLSIIMSYLFSKFYNIKKIICVIITFIIVLILKMIITILTNNAIMFNVGNVINIAFVALFSLIGAMLCPDKK